MPKYRDGWKPHKSCKVCKTIKIDEPLYTRIMESSQYMRGGEPLTTIAEDYKDFFTYQGLFNHCKKHQAPNGDQLAVRRMAQVQKEHDKQLYQRAVKTLDARQELIDRMFSKLEDGEFDDQMTVKDFLTAMRDSDNAAAKKKDQDIDILKAIMPSRSGEVIRGEVIEEEFDPWDEQS